MEISKSLLRCPKCLKDLVEVNVGQYKADCDCIPKEWRLIVG